MVVKKNKCDFDWMGNKHKFMKEGKNLVITENNNRKELVHFGQNSSWWLCVQFVNGRNKFEVRVYITNYLGKLMCFFYVF